MSEVAPGGAKQGEVRGVVVTHGAMGRGLMDAVRTIAGARDVPIEIVSNEGLGPEELVDAVKAVSHQGPTLIFTDLQTGSCAFAARLACAAPGGRRVVFGVNLPMLLDFVFHRDLPLDELVEHVVDRGREAIRPYEAK